MRHEELVLTPARLHPWPLRTPCTPLSPEEEPWVCHPREEHWAGGSLLHSFLGALSQRGAQGGAPGVLFIAAVPPPARGEPLGKVSKQVSLSTCCVLAGQDTFSVLTCPTGIFQRCTAPAAVRLGSGCVVDRPNP